MAGNISEPSTLKLMLDQLTQQTGESSQQSFQKRTVVLDAGIATEDNLKWLSEEKYQYVVVSRSKKTMPEKGKLITLKAGPKSVQGKLIRNKTTEEWELYCISEDRKKKEQAIKSLFRQRFEDNLKQIGESLHKPSGTKKLEKVHQRIGRAKEKYKRISALYEIKVVPDEYHKNAVEVTWELLVEKETKKLTGVYCLRSNIKKTTATSLWSIYTNLNQVEEAFRAMKSELGMRPVFHQKEHRVDAHLFITLLAYHIMHSIRLTLKKAGISQSWESIRNILCYQFRVTTSVTTKEKKIIHIRKNARANIDQKIIYRAMGMKNIVNVIKKTMLDKNGNVVT